MSIQLVGSIGSLWQTIRNDFKNFGQDLAAFQSAQKSGSQDQTSQNDLQQAITSILNDITSVQSSAAGTTAGTTNSSSNAGKAANPLQTLTQDLTAFQTTLNSGDQDKIQSLESALQNDISAVRGHHHHHHHAAAGTTSGTTDSSNAGKAANPFQTLSQDLTAFQTALNSGDQDKIQSLESALQNDISALQSYRYLYHHHHTANGATGGYASSNSQQQSTGASSVNLTV